MAGDPSFASVTSLLHFDGADGSTSFPDVTGKVWTPFGNAKISTAQSMFGGACLALDGTGDYLSTPYNTGFAVTSDFTIEAWVRLAQSKVSAIACCLEGASGGFSFQLNTGGFPAIYLGTGTYIGAVSPVAVTLNQWTHIAGVRSGNNLHIFSNGVLRATAVLTSAPKNTATTVLLGQDPLTPTRALNGFIDEFRFTRVARYTSNFTPPTAAFPDVLGPETPAAATRVWSFIS